MVDRTLPVNFDDSCNPDLLSDVTYGEHGMAPMMENVNSGRSSPIRGRTMKEYEQQIGSLKKENFNLKLRIYFLEERIGQKYSQEDIIKTNIELKVECESYKKDIEEKKQLLEKASSAIDTLTSQSNEKFENEIVGIKQECENKVEQANKRVEVLQSKLKDSEEKIKTLENLKADLADRDSEVAKLTEALKKVEKEFTEYRLDSDKDKTDLKDELEKLSVSICRRDRDIKRLSVIVEEDKKLVDVGVSPLERSKLKDAAEDAKNQVIKLQNKCAEKDNALLDKDERIGKLEDLLRAKEKELGDTKNELAVRMKGYTKAKNSLMEALCEIKNKHNMAEDLRRKVESLERELNEAREECELAKMDRRKENDKIMELEENAERLARSLGKKEGELENFRDLLEKAQASLCKSEEAVELLQRQLEQERKVWKEEKKKYNDMENELRALKGKGLDPRDPHQHFHINIHSSHATMDGAPTYSDMPMQEDVQSLHKKIEDLESEKKKLQNLLEATEQTAHCQTQKMKNYRQMLADHGLLPPSMRRASSEQALTADNGWSAQSDSEKSSRRSRFRSVDQMAPRGRSVSPTPHYKGYDLTDNEKLRQEIEKLKEENKGYKNVLKFIQNGNPSPDSSMSGQDGEAGPTEVPYKMLSKWLDQLDKFLSEISHGDKNTSVPLPQGSCPNDEVKDLRRGLVQARGAIRSLSVSCGNSQGRESPDSGCSDHNPASLQNNSLKSPIHSPSNSQSADNSPRSDRSSPRLRGLDKQTSKQAGSVSNIVTQNGNHPDNNRLLSHMEVMRGTSSNGDYGDECGISMFQPMDMTDVFKMDPHQDSMESSKHKNSVRFSMANQSRNISPRHSPHDIHDSPTDSHDGDNTFYKTLSQSQVADMTALADPQTSMSSNLLDITMSAKADTHHHIETMNKIIQSYEEVKSSLNPDALHEHMLELQQLRKLLEKQLRQIEMLQDELNEMNHVSERKIQERDDIIQDLREQLNETADNMNQKIKIISELRIELTTRMESAQMAEMTTENLRSQVRQLETQHQNDKKYEDLLHESRSQIDQLSVELEELKEHLRRTDSELYHERAEVQLCKDTIDEQTKQLYEKDSKIEELYCDIRKKDEVLEHQDQLCNELDKTVANLVAKNKEMTNQMEEQKLNCADYRKQIEKQNLMNRELKERADQLRDELSQSISNRETLEKELVNKTMKSDDDEKKKDKLIYNLNLMKTEYKKLKYRFNESERRSKDKSAEINTLHLSLRASEKLLSEKELTDDETQNYTLMLLNTVKELQQQLRKVLEQNDKITQQMAAMTQRTDDNQNSRPASASNSDLQNINVHVKTRISMKEGLRDTYHTPMSNGNNTWPSAGSDGSFDHHLDHLSNSLPIRERTPGGPALGDSFSKQTSASSKRSISSLPSLGDQMSHDPLGMARTDCGGHFSVPGPIYKQRMTDQCLLYHVNDSPREIARLTQFRIDSDIRCLFAIAMIDHFEKLKKETYECHAILKGMNCRISDRLETFARGPASQMIKSMEYGTLKELSYSVDNLRICVDSQVAMIDGFWTSELPAPNEKGEFVNQKLLDEKAALEEELASFKMKFQSLTDRGNLDEEKICESLMSTLNVVTQARKNLEQKNK